MAPRKIKTPTPWDIAKPLLEKDYLEGRVTDHMQPRDVIKLREEYKQVKVENFRSNFNAMKKRIQMHKAQAIEDDEYFSHDNQLYTFAKDLPEYWDGSDAQQLLIDDIDAGLHKALKPKQLHLFRPEYQ
jgi:heme oxygenase